MDDKILSKVRIKNSLTMSIYKMTIGMPELSDQEDVIEVEFEERENGGTQMFSFISH